nr:hypothetical protein [uncultured Dyadobacter sp.]
MAPSINLSNPFPGLRSYEYEDSTLFFGRDLHIRELKNKLLEGRFLALIGSSGSGKSSLIKAGLIPSLEAAGSGQPDWNVVLFKPGAHPVRNLLAAFKMQLRKKFGTGVAAGLNEDEMTAEGMRATIMELLPALGGGRLLLVIDQFEEIFRYDLARHTLTEARTETALFIALILELIQGRESDCYAAITMRSDYLDNCTEFKGLTEAINTGYYLLPKMTTEEIREVIVKPIEVTGGVIAPELTALLLQEISTSPDALPILQHALLRTWDKWMTAPSDPALITISDYEAIGTMKNAITIHAEEIFNQKLDDRRKLAAEKLFKALVVSGPSDTPELHPIALSEIVRITGVADYQLIDVIQAFRAKGVSFLSPNPGVTLTPDSIIDLTVERIMVLWVRLGRWIGEEMRSAKLYKQLSANALMYQDGKAGLWVNPELQLGLKWQKDNQPNREWARRYDPYFERAINYLDYSRKQHESELKNEEERQKRVLRQSRVFAMLGVGVGMVATVAVLYLTYLQAETRQALRESDVKGQTAQAEKKRAEEQSQKALVQSRIAQQQQEIAEQQRELTRLQKENAERQEEKARASERAARIAQNVAVEQQQRARRSELAAREAEQRAELGRQAIQKEKLRGDTLLGVAEQARKKADAATQQEKQLRLIAIARSIAIQSFQMPDSRDDLAALLALQAYKFNDKDSPDIFNALAKAADAKTVLRRHSDAVRTLDINPGHTRLASGSDDGTLKIWNINDLTQRPQSFELPRGTRQDIRSALFTNDGVSVLAGSDQGAIFQWRYQIGNALPETIRAHKAPIHTLAYAGKGLISVSADGVIRTWKITERSLDSLEHIRSGLPILSAKASPDNKVLMCGSTNGRLLAFDLDNLKKAPVIYTFAELGTQVGALAFSPDGKRLITSNNFGSLHAWNLVHNAISGRGYAITGRHTSTVNSIIFSPNGKQMASASFDGSVHLWNYKDILLQQQPIVIHDYDNWVMGLCFTADSNRLISCGADKSVRVWDINPDQLYARIIQNVKRNFTTDEWNTYIGKDVSYQKIIP